MKVSKLAVLVAAVAAMGLAPLAHAQTGQSKSKSMEAVKTMDADKDGMITKAEFVRMMEARFDAMDKAKTGRLTPAQVQEVIDSIGKQFGYSN
jgi:Ca2+-binding EF-hand superfamily protein